MSFIERVTSLVTLSLLGSVAACASAPAAKPVSRTAVTSTLAEASPNLATTTGPLEDPFVTRLHELRNEHHAIGVCAALVDIDIPTRVLCSGVRRNDQPDPIQNTDRFHLGSDTKAITATLAASIVEQGLIHWDTKIEDIFPKLKINKLLRKTTLLDLLSHRAGITGSIDGPLSNLLKELRDRSGDLPSQRLWMTERVLALPPAQPPRTTFLYSNLGYVIAGAMLETVTGRAWEELTAERIFQPLGMASCGFGAPNKHRAEPYGHLPGEHGMVPVPPGPDADNPLAIGPAGTVHCNLEDWGRFAHAHLVGETGRAPILSAESYVRLHTPPSYGAPVSEPDYALGWTVVINPKTGKRALAHTGSNTMFYAEAWLFPDEGRAYLVGLNDASEAGSATANAVLLDLFEKVPPRAPRRP